MSKLLTGSVYILFFLLLALLFPQVIVIPVNRNSPHESKVGEGPRGRRPRRTAPVCAGCTAPKHSTALPSAQPGQVGIIFTAVRVKRCAYLRGERVCCRVTLILCSALSAQWKEAAKTRSRPTKRLLRAKTSATMDHCQLSLQAANSPPARTAPGPGPVSLTVAEDKQPQYFYFL